MKNHVKRKKMVRKKTDRTARMHIRCTPSEMKEIKKNAKKVTDGNVSAYLRTSAMYYKPLKKDTPKW